MRAALLATLLAAAGAAADDRRSTYADMSPALRAMQDDDMANPAMLWVLEGEALWREPAGREGRACADCHGAPETMAGVAARHPVWDEGAGRALDLEGRVARCREARQGADPWPRESREMLAATALIALQSRGLPVAPSEDPRLDPLAERGAALWRTRMGQLNLSCAQCHDDNAGGRLGSATVPQAHPVGYPIYRLEWQDMGSLERRLRTCLSGVRAEPFAPASDEPLALTLHLFRRAAGMTVESPAVRP